MDLARLVDALPDVDITAARYQEARCNICYGDFRNPSDLPNASFADSEENSEVAIQLPCGHLLGKECMLEWLRSHNNCPVCRVCVFNNLDPFGQIIPSGESFAEDLDYLIRLCEHLGDVGLDEDWSDNPAFARFKKRFIEAGKALSRIPSPTVIEFRDEVRSALWRSSGISLQARLTLLDPMLLGLDFPSTRIMQLFTPDELYVMIYDVLGEELWLKIFMIPPES